MKSIKWKILAITCLFCLVPILPGVFLWDALPDSMAIHFNLNNEPDNFAPKGFVVFGLPCLLMLLQFVCCICNDIKMYKRGNSLKLEMITKWILPVVTVILMLTTLMFNLGWGVDVRKIAMLIVGVIFLLVGICLLEVHYIKYFKVDADKARKINRFWGVEMIVMGMFAFITTFLPPVATLVWLLALMLSVFVGIIYCIKIAGEKGV